MTAALSSDDSIHRPGGHLADAPNRVGAKTDPAQVRDLDGAAGDQAGQVREGRAATRDTDAATRDTDASLRDLAAKRRDVHHDQLLSGTLTITQVPKLHQDLRHHAAHDRQRAAADRNVAAHHRHSAERDRYAAAAARSASAADRQHASVDPLTGAYDRAAGLTELARDIDRVRRHHQSLTLAFLDVDGLKAINDTRGHAAGDRALRQVVDALRNNLRARDLIIRFGGDEFLCAFTAINHTEATGRFQRVNHALAQASEHASVRYGLATLRPHETLHELLQRAHTAFYASRKRKGPAADRR